MSDLEARIIRLEQQLDALIRNLEKLQDQAGQNAQNFNALRNAQGTN